MSRFYKVGALVVLGAAALAAIGLTAGHPSAIASNLLMPEFENSSPNAWLNSAPIRASSLRGKVVLLEVYASG